MTRTHSISLAVSISILVLGLVTTVPLAASAGNEYSGGCYDSSVGCAIYHPIWQYWVADGTCGYNVTTNNCYCASEEWYQNTYNCQMPLDN